MESLNESGTTILAFQREKWNNVYEDSNFRSEENNAQVKYTEENKKGEKTEKNRQFVGYGVNALDLKGKRKYFLLQVNQMSSEQPTFTAISANALVCFRLAFLLHRPNFRQISWSASFKEPLYVISAPPL